MYTFVFCHCVHLWDLVLLFFCIFYIQSCSHLTGHLCVRLFLIVCISFIGHSEAIAENKEEKAQ